MIYCVIFDTKERENSIIKKNDCRALRQSVPYLPQNILEYVASAKNDLSRAEREAAYTSLFVALKAFFDIENPTLSHENSKKPTITSHNIFFNISHSDGIAVVSLSDNCDLGVDIQTDPDDLMKKRLEKRFLSDLDPKSEELEIDFYLLEKSEGDLLLSGILCEQNNSEFSDKWTAMESVMKLYGDGFSALPRLNELSTKSTTNIVNIRIADKRYSISNSIKNG